MSRRDVQTAKGDGDSLTSINWYTVNGTERDFFMYTLVANQAGVVTALLKAKHTHYGECNLIT